ncbi:MAG: hypothetical protein CVT84_13555 [Alphaproteobacteria bacterium HGW-Alphaproteobacteria-6]|nr:MAG: hypothetical protein CVT84_13555 [Alphaproteobacteria bacterium HGW-Alphaproteobacteria-6]
MRASSTSSRARRKFRRRSSPGACWTDTCRLHSARARVTLARRAREGAMTVALPVFVTGASGFVGKHVVLDLLRAGHAVRASVRGPAMADQVRRAVLPHLGDDPGERLNFVTLDLTRDEGWAAAMAGCSALLHTASPFPIAQPKDPDEVIRPAVDGTRRALAAAVAAGIDRVILTSSTVAMIRRGHIDGRAFDEADWADSDGPPDLALYPLQGHGRAPGLGHCRARGAAAHHHQPVVHPRPAA